MRDTLLLVLLLVVVVVGYGVWLEKTEKPEKRAVSIYKPNGMDLDVYEAYVAVPIPHRK